MMSKCKNLNFQTLQEKQLSQIYIDFSALKRRPTLALHSCCAPCSSYVLEYLLPFFDITIFFYNPNIYPPEEFLIRLKEQDAFRKKINNTESAFITIKPSPIKLSSPEYIPEEFYNAIDIKQYPERAREIEKGTRCQKCYQLRLEKTADYALKNNIDFFTSTLSISPHKDALQINIEGKRIEKNISHHNLNYPKYLYSDFKKKNGFKRSIEISKEYNMYRQDYCGCIYSKNNILP